MENKKKFFFLNLENRWPSFKLNGLEINPNGSLTLTHVPKVENSEEITYQKPEGLQVPAGITTDKHGNVYLSDPIGHRIFKYDICTENIEPIPCLDREKNKVGLNTPRGLLVGKNDILYVVDSGNHLVLLFDLDTLQLENVWGQAEPFIKPRSSDEPGKFKDPWEIAEDSAGSLYVVDHGNQRIQKFNSRGNVITDFWNVLYKQVKTANLTLQEPCFISITKIGDEERIFVVDCRPNIEDDLVFVFDTKGHLKIDKPWPITVPPGSYEITDKSINELKLKNVPKVILNSLTILRRNKPIKYKEFLKSLRKSIGIIHYNQYKTLILKHTIPTEYTKVKSAGIAVIEDSVYIGDNAREAVLKFRTNGKFVGQARGYDGPVAALCIDSNGNLLLHPGEPPKMVRLFPGRAFLPKGSFLAGPYNPEDTAVQWHRLQVQAEQIPEEAQLKLFAYTSNEEQEPIYLPDTENPFDDEDWHPIPTNTLDALIPSLPHNNISPLSKQYAEANAPLPRVSAKYLWLGGLFWGDETVSPTIHRIRIDYNQDTYLRYLPPIYAKDNQSREFLERFLSLFEGVLDGVEEQINRLPKYFDSYAVPERFLPWLASWVAMDLDEDWSEQKKRDAIAKAFELQAKRGTVEGLMQYLKLYANVDAIIEEPLLTASLWCLPAKKETIKAQTEQPECWLICPPTSTQDQNDEQKNLQAQPNDIWLHTDGSLLGFSTMLAPAHAQGAVVGTTATLDQSHLIEDKDFGAPLFEDVAHFFYVLVYWCQLKCQKDVEKIKTIIEREKPAHTDYHLCTIEPKMRVGFQSRVGIDTIVSEEAPDMVLTRSTKLGQDTIISEFGGRRRDEGRIAQDSRVGIKTSLS